MFVSASRLTPPCLESNGSKQDGDSKRQNNAKNQTEIDDSKIVIRHRDPHITSTIHLIPAVRCQAPTKHLTMKLLNTSIFALLFALGWEVRHSKSCQKSSPAINDAGTRLSECSHLACDGNMYRDFLCWRCVFAVTAYTYLFRTFCILQ
jgi:hypothetical protein